MQSWLCGVATGALALGLLVALTGCDESVDRMLKDAEGLHAGGNIPAAAHKVEAVLTRDPKNIPARLLASQISIEMSQGNAALGLLLRAQQDGAPEREIAKPRAEAELVAHQYDEVVRDTAKPPDGLSTAAGASLLAYRAVALGALGHETEARATLEQGLALDPHSVDVRIAAARLAIERHDVNAARSALDDALRDAPTDRRLKQLRGDIAYAAQDYDSGAQIYQKILDAEPWNQLVRGELGAVLLAQNKVAEAISTVKATLNDPALADVPKLPILNYIRAVAAFRQQDYDSAQTNAALVITNAPQFGPAWLIAGAASYALHADEQAYYYLSPYVAENPGDIRAKSLMAETQLRLGQAADAAKTLAPVRDKANGDPDLLGLIGLAAARSGDPATAERYFKLALDHRPDDQRLRAELGLAEIAAGDPKSAVDNLEQVVKASPNGSGPQLPLFVALLQTKEYDKALAIAERVIQSESGAPTGQLLASTVYLSQGNVAGGRAALLKARAIDPGNVSANSNLARLALADGKADEARQYYQDIIAAHPESAPTYIILAELDIRAGHPQDAEAVLKKGTDANPTDVATRIALLRVQLARGAAQEAVAGGHAALKKFPRNPALLDVVGHAELALGQHDAALSTFHDLADLVPKAAWAHTNLAEAYLALYTPENPQWGAVNEATEAVRLDPKDPVAKLVLGRALAIHGRFEEAAKVAAELKAANPQDVGAIELEALVARGQGRLADAAGAFGRAVAANDNAIDRRRLADLEVRLGRTDGAVRTLTTWVDAHPADIGTRKMLAEIDAKAGRLAEAHEQYADLVNREPKEPEIQNNLAWVLSRQGQAEEALAHARAAVALAPNAVEFRDTLGAILLQTGNSEGAVAPLDEAWRNGADRPHIGYHLSQALAATGKKNEALALLRQLLAGKRPFAERAQAQALLHNLGG